MTIENINTASAVGVQPVLDQNNTRKVAETASAAPAQAATQDVSSSKKPAPTSQDISHAVDKINKFVQLATNDIQFTVDKDTDLMVVKVIDRETRQLIRQVPSDEIIQIAKALDDFRGLLVKQHA